MATLLDFLRVPALYIALAIVPAALYVAIAVAVRIYRQTPLGGALRRSIAEAVLLIFTFAILAVAVRPNEGIQGSPPNLMPLRGILASRSASDLLLAVANLLGNAAIFAVWAAALRVVLPGLRLSRCFALALAFSATLELVQALSIEGRTGDIDDVLANLAGAIVGFRLQPVVSSVFGRGKKPVTSAGSLESASNP